jgi:hypothetical protein
LGSSHVGWRTFVVDFIVGSHEHLKMKNGLKFGVSEKSPAIAALLSLVPWVTLLQIVLWRVQPLWLEFLPENSFKNQSVVA